MNKMKKILSIFVLSFLLISVSSYTFAVDINDSNSGIDINTTDEIISNTTESNTDSTVTIFELVDDKSCIIDLGNIGRFEKKVADFDATEKSITLELTLTNIAEKQEDVIKPSELFLVIDNSNSMIENITTGGITRKQAVLESANVLAENLFEAYPDLKIGVVSFSSKDGSEGTLADANLEQALTNNPDEVKAALSNIEAASGIRTNIDAGLTIAEQNYTDEDNTKVLVLLSDGVPNNDAHGNFATYSGVVANNTRAKLQELGTAGINVIGAMIGLDSETVEPSTQRTYQDLAEEIFGTTEQPTVGNFYYIPDEQIEQTIREAIYSSLIPAEETKLRNVVIKDYFPQEIIDNFDFEYVASPNIGNVSAEIDKSDNSITWSIDVLNEGEMASLRYKLILKDDFNIEILDKILPTNENVDITYNDDGHVESDDSPTVRVRQEKTETPPPPVIETNTVDNNVVVNTAINKVDNTIANEPIPQTGNNSFTTLIAIAAVSVVLAMAVIKLKNQNK